MGDINTLLDSPLLSPLVVYPSDEPEFSGLLDARGYALIRHREPIGFKLDYGRHKDTDKAGATDC